MDWGSKTAFHVPTRKKTKPKHAPRPRMKLPQLNLYYNKLVKFEIRFILKERVKFLLHSIK